MENATTNTSTAAWKVWLKKTGIFLLKLLCLVYTMKYLWNSVKNFFGLLKSICSTSQYDCQKARSNRANAWGETHYECNGCGRKLPTGRIDCPFCGYASQKPTKDPNAKGCFYCLFMLPFNLAMVIITALPLLLILAAISGQLPK